MWGWFLDLARCRQYGGMGSPMPIGYRDIAAWREITGAEPEPWELKALFDIDGVWLEQIGAETKTARKSS